MSRSIPTSKALKAPASTLIQRCSTCETQREFDPVAVRDIQAKDHRFAVVYRCRFCKAIEVKMFKKHITSKGLVVAPPTIGLEWL